MDTELILTIGTVISGVILMILILVQNKGVGLSGALTGGGGMGNAYRTKRGAEKVLYRATIGFSIVFLGLAFSHLFV